MKMANELKGLEDRYQLQTYGKFPFFIDKGAGCYVYDEEGNKYLDFYGAHAVASTGHCHPQVVKAIQKQAAELIFYSNVSYNSARARAVKRAREGDDILATGDGSRQLEGIFIGFAA